MKIEIKQRPGDRPEARARSRRRRSTSPAGTRRRDRRGAVRLARRPRDRRARTGRLPGPHRPVRAAARAGLRIQGDARIRDGGGGRRRSDEPRLSAGHRSAARRAGPGRDAEAPRALAQPGACLSDRRADRRARGRRAHRNGRARRGGLRRVLAGRGAVDDTGVLLRAMQYAATFGHRVWLRAAGRASRQGRRRARRRSFDAPRLAGDSARRRKRSRSRRSWRSSAAPACGSTSAGSRPPKASRWCGPRSAEGLAA